MNDRIRAEYATRDLCRVSAELAAEIRRRKAAEAELARARMEIEVLRRMTQGA